MKTTITSLIFVIVTLCTFAQTPQSFNYQAVLRDASGNILANQNIEIQVDILQGSASGSAILSETHSTTTNNFGLVNLTVGSISSTDLSNIDWTDGPFFIQISVDGTVMGTSQLLSVPFAMHAITVENDAVEDDDADPENEIQVLSINADTIFLSSGGFVVLPPETDPAFTNWDKSSGITISESQISDIQHFNSDSITGNETAFEGWDKNANDDFTTADETDPVFSSSLAAAITAEDTARWASNNYTQNELQKLKLENQQLSISGGNTIDLSDAYYIADSSATNELQDISLNGTQLSISKGSSVDLASLQDGTGTDNQTISLDGNQLVISNGNRIYLPYIRTEGDSNPFNEIQTLSIANDTISLSRDGGQVKLPAETDPVFSASVAVAITSADTANWNRDTSATNELQTISRSGLTVALSRNGGTFQDSILTEADVDKMVENNGYQLAADDEDTDSTNELQFLNISNDTIFLSKGNYAKLPSLSKLAAINNSIATQLKNVSAPTDALDAVNKSYLDSMLMAIGDINILLNTGYTIPQIFKSRRTVQEFLTAGLTYQDFIDAGVSYSQILNSGGIVPDLLDSIGLTYSDLLIAGVTYQEILGSGGTVKNLLNEDEVEKDDLIGLLYSGGIIYQIEDDSTGWVCSPKNLGNKNWNSAMQACSELSYNGFDDWVLPSADQLRAIGENNAKINATAISVGGDIFSRVKKWDSYWSSNEYNNDSAYLVNFINGIETMSGWHLKSNSQKVRPVRKFIE